MFFSELAGKNGIFVDGDWIEKKDQDPKGVVRLIQLADIGAGAFLDKSQKYITKEKAKELNCTYLHKGDILIARLGEPLCKTCIFPYDGLYITAVDIAILRVGIGNINPKYIVNLLNSPWFKERIKPFESGTTRKRISRKNLDRIDIPLPSFDNQNQVVQLLEDSLSQLDSAVETLKKTKQQLEIYRQAVLSSAFDLLYELRNITEFFEVTSGLTKNSNRNNFSIKMPYLRVANVYFDNLDLREIKEIGVLENEIKQTLLKKDDLLFVEGNGSKSQIGRVAIWDGSIKNILHQNHIIKARPNGKMQSKYALYYFMSSFGRKQIMEVASSTSGLYTLSTNKIRNLKIPYLNFDLQKELVESIELKLSIFSNIESTVSKSLQQAESLRQSILKQAFEGE